MCPEGKPEVQKGEKRELQEERVTMSDSIRSKIQELENEVNNDWHQLKLETHSDRASISPFCLTPIMQHAMHCSWPCSSSTSVPKTCRDGVSPP